MKITTEKFSYTGLPAFALVSHTRKRAAKANHSTGEGVVIFDNDQRNNNNENVH
jgi:hypothetical protein